MKKKDAMFLNAFMARELACLQALDLLAVTVL